MESKKQFENVVSLNLEKFAKLQGELLNLERTCEVERAQDLVRAHSSDARELEKRGLALRRVVAAESRTGLYGRTVITYTKEKSVPLPATSISNGDIVGVFSTSESSEKSIEAVPSGVVTQVTVTSLSVSFDESIESLGLDDDAPVNVIKLANDVTHKRLKSALERVTNENGFSVLHHALFATTELSVPLQELHPNILDQNKEIKFINSNLNDSQRDAVRFALLQRELAIVHGPPGTGKTTTIVEIISQEVAQGHRVLCCAPSNVAVDNLLDKLSKNRIRVLRLGHPARLNQDLVKHSLDAVLSQSDQTQLVQDVRSDVDKAVGGLKRARGEGERRRLRNELKVLRKELREREKKAMRDILQKADVVLSTLTSASEEGPLKNLPKEKSLFDVTVIDECSQSLEMACWIAMLQSKKAILAGDHLQLPPTIMSVEAAKKGLSLTLMERAIQVLGKGVVKMLNMQYRMNTAIMNWSSKAFYDNELVAHSSVAGRLLKDLPGVKSDENTDVPLVLIDTSGCDMFEVESGDDISKANEGEVALVCIHTQQLIESGIDPADIAVITPYNLQVELIRLQLSEKYPTLEVRSVDGFQGREKEAVILSLVRSNNQGEIGFLSEHRRLNVAVTRAKRHVAVICNVDTVSKDPILATFVEYLTTHGDVRTASQYQHLVDAADVIRPHGMEFVLKDSNEKVTPQKNDKKSSNKVDKKAVDKKQKVSKEIKKAAEIEPKKNVEREKSKDEEIESTQRREELVKMVQKFVDSANDKTFRCSPDLNSYERMLVHEIAAEFQLEHESQGEGVKRHIVLRKLKDGDEKEETPETKKSSSEPSTKPKTKVSANGSSASLKVSTQNQKSDSDVVVCSGCHREVPKINIDLHKIRCQNSSVNLNVGGSKKSKQGKKKEELLAEEDEIDKLLESFGKLDTVCNAEKCKTPVSVLGVNCNFCRIRFCLSHALPEAHGCGDAARRAARQQISRDGKLYSGSGRPDMKPDAAKKAQLQRKLDKKLNELGDDRKPKPKKK